jgi:hypothetical protein
VKWLPGYTSICFFFLLFQTLEETITVIVPQNAKNVYDSIVEIINAFKIIINLCFSLKINKLQNKIMGGKCG